MAWTSSSLPRWRSGSRQRPARPGRGATQAERTEEGGPSDGAALFGWVGVQKFEISNAPICFKRRARALSQPISICGRVEIGAYKGGERNGMRYVIAIDTNIDGQYRATVESDAESS